MKNPVLEGLTHALSLTQPWASLVACGEKRIETRSWPTRFRGLVAIHASKGFPRECRALCTTAPFQSALQRVGIWSENGGLPTGAIIAVVELRDCWRFYEQRRDGAHPCAEHEYAFGDYTPGRYGFALADVRLLPKPVPCKGALGFWRLPDDVRVLLGGSTELDGKS